MSGRSRSRLLLWESYSSPGDGRDERAREPGSRIRLPHRLAALLFRVPRLVWTAREQDSSNSELNTASQAAYDQPTSAGRLAMLSQQARATHTGISAVPKRAQVELIRDNHPMFVRKLICKINSQQ